MSFYSSSDSEESISSDDDSEHQGGASSEASSGVVLHMDVDYFYAQCEELELDDSSKQRPIAVGQKHIIVTCNYVARAQGVQKLMLQTNAKKKCPSLLIVDGSDLERYRRYSTQIYQALRQETLSMSSEYENVAVAMKKGGMDEVASGVSALVDAIMSNGNGVMASSAPQNAFIYGNEDSSVVLTEDQSGAQCTVSHSVMSNESMSNNHAIIQQRLHVAATCAERLRQAIYTKTRFTTSIGVSTSPMLSKIASSLRKPNGLCILYPWRATSLIQTMPLRSIPQLGSKTLKSLGTCLERHNTSRKTDKDSFWTCRDLLQVPRYEILTCLQTMSMTRPASEALCDDLMNKCRGVDNTCIEDDGGGLSKTVSVENSFRRHSVRTADDVIRALQDLYLRLPRLLDDRRNNSHSPDQAYPTTIRVITGVVDKRLLSTKRRPFVTKSKQCSFASGGKALMKTSDEVNRSDMLQEVVRPLINSLLFNGGEIDVVRINIAVTGFQDLTLPTESPSTAASPWAAFAMKRGPTEQERSDHKKPKSQATISNDTKQVRVPPSPFAKSSGVASRQKGRDFVQPCSADIDPAVLAELPADIQAEVLRTCSSSTKASSSKHTIDHFFSKKE